MQQDVKLGQAMGGHRVAHLDEVRVGVRLRLRPRFRPIGLGFSLGVGVGLGLELGPGLEPTLMTMVSSMKAKISLMGVSSNVCVGLGDS